MEVYPFPKQRVPPNAIPKNGQHKQTPPPRKLIFDCL